MRSFRYFRDPLFLAGCASYVVNRWFIKPHFHAGFFHSYFNDAWLIPCALPPVLWLHRRLGLRSHDAAPGAGEILSHLAFWSLLFEWIGPRLLMRSTGDPLDVLAYAAGALFAGWWWHRADGRLASASHEL
jgi:hypothetical protein